MKKNLSIAPVVLIVVLLQNFTGPRQTHSSTNEDMWTGNIIFRQITYDTVYGTHVCGWQTDRSWGEWRMQASIINNIGTAKSSSNGRRHGTSADTCVNVNGTGAIKTLFMPADKLPQNWC